MVSVMTTPAPIQAPCPNGTLTLLPRQGYQVRYTPTAPVIGFAFDSQFGHHSFASSRIRPFMAKPDSLSLVPAGCDIFSHSANGGEYLTLSLDQPLCFAAYQQNNITHPQARQTATALRRLLLLHYRDSLAIEQLSEQLISHTLNYFKTTPEKPSGNWCNHRRLRLVEDYIDAFLDQDLSITALANYLQLSPGFFSRDFKKATGKSPYDYIIDKRVSRARQLITTTQKNLTNIALACGFASHAHMSSTFQQRLGVSPRQLRC